MGEVRVLLIGGTSHAGKSTLARAVASWWECDVVSTDRLARHPGRPWSTDGRPLPEHVVAHYRSSSVEELTVRQLRHYRRLWPRIEELIEAHTGVGADRLVLEGSGVLPERVAAMSGPHVAALWLTADAPTLRRRIHATSRYPQRPPEQQILVRKFVGRTRRYQELILDTVARRALTRIDTSAGISIEEPVRRCRELLGATDAPPVRAPGRRSGSWPRVWIGAPGRVT